MSQIHDISQGQTLEYWKKRAHQSEENCAAIASELYTIQELIANPSLTDKEKVCTIAYLQWYKATPPARPNGARYYSRQQIAERMGGSRVIPERPGPKEQAFGPVHTKLKKAGLIAVHTEAQKGNKSLPNYYDTLSPQFELNARHILLEKSEKASLRGGRRIALHRECGGMCVERTTYACTKCGRGNIDTKHILMVDEEKWEGWKNDSVPCVHCGNEIQPDAILCVSCGCSQNDIPAPDVEDTPEPTQGASRGIDEKQPDYSTDDAPAQRLGVLCIIHHTPLNSRIGVYAWNGEPQYGCAECAKGVSA